MKRKMTSTRRRLFAKEHYIKPAIMERVIRRASIVWKDLAGLELSGKPVTKWTIKQKEGYVKALNKYSCITSKDDPGTDRGDLYDIVERVNRYLLDGNDDEMLNWLDPDYIVVDWTNAQQQLSFSDVSTVVPPLSPNVAVNNTIQPNCYLVQGRADGEYLLGIINHRWPGTMGFVTSSPSPLIFRSL